MSKPEFETLLSAVRRLDPPVNDPHEALAENRVLVDGAVRTNPKSRVRRGASVRVLPSKETLRGSLKLDPVLDAFGVEVAGRRAVDLGACTGGFTTVLLERGAAHVFAVDVGHGQLLGTLRQDLRVTNLEQTNVADLTPQILGGTVDLAVSDVTKLPLGEVARQVAGTGVLRDGADFVGLVKPMFELKMGKLPRGVTELDAAVDRATAAMANAGFVVLATTLSPQRGRHGAVEFFVHARWQPIK